MQLRPRGRRPRSLRLSEKRNVIWLPTILQNLLKNTPLYLYLFPKYNVIWLSIIPTQHDLTYQLFIWLTKGAVKPLQNDLKNKIEGGDPVFRRQRMFFSKMFFHQLLFYRRSVPIVTASTRGIYALRFQTKTRFDFKKTRHDFA
jgi:hypothetical protein